MTTTKKNLIPVDGTFTINEYLDYRDMNLADRIHRIYLWGECEITYDKDDTTVSYYDSKRGELWITE